MSKLDRIMSKLDVRMQKLRVEYDKLDRIIIDPTSDPFLKKLARYAIPKVIKRHNRAMRARRQLYKQLENRDGE